MTTLKCLMLATAIGLSPLVISAQAAEDPHHPGGAALAQTVPQAQPTPLAAAPAPGGQPGAMGMMGNMPMMNMMNMMGMMQMMGGSGDAPGMGMTEHVEGRIAFLRTELKITDAQTRVWNAFADALRANARNLGAARMGMMGPAQAQTLAQRLDAQERWLAARLEGTRTLKASFTGLYAALSAEQKKTADEVLAPHMGMMAMGQMPMGQMGQPGQMGPTGQRPQ